MKQLNLFFYFDDIAVQFLDAIVYKNANKWLVARLYKTPTDRNYLLHLKPFHP